MPGLLAGASTSNGAAVGAFMFWGFVPFCALMIFPLHWAQMEKKYAPEQYVYRRRWHLILFIVFLPEILSGVHHILGTNKDD